MFEKGRLHDSEFLKKEILCPGKRGQTKATLGEAQVSLLDHFFYIRISSPFSSIACLLIFSEVSIFQSIYCLFTPRYVFKVVSVWRCKKDGA